LNKDYSLTHFVDAMKSYSARVRRKRSINKVL
jgi:hypothetical protein